MSDSTPATFNVGDELYKLEKLREHYQQLLDTAIQQLEQIELKDEQLAALASNIAGNSNFMGRLGWVVATELQRAAEPDGSWLSSERFDDFTKRIADSAMSKLAQRLSNQVSIAVDAYMIEHLKENVQDRLESILSNETRAQRAKLSALADVLGDIARDNINERASGYVRVHAENAEVLMRQAALNIMRECADSEEAKSLINAQANESKSLINAQTNESLALIDQEAQKAARLVQNRYSAAAGVQPSEESKDELTA